MASTMVVVPGAPGDGRAVTTKLNIHDAILAVMEHVGAVGKTGFNPQGNFNFRGVDAVVNAVYPALLLYGVSIAPQLVQHSTSEVAVGKNRTPMSWAEVVICYTLTAPDGSSVQWIAPGAAMDSGDKAVSKACSVAYRTALLQGLCLPTTDPILTR